MKSIARNSLLVIIGCCLAWVAQAVQFYASVDKTSGTLEDYFQLTLTVKDLNGAKQPDLPQSPDFRMNYQGQSSQMQVVNGSVTSQITFNYLLTPLKVGKLAIPSATISVGGQEYRSNPIHLVITKPADGNGSTFNKSGCEVK